MLRDAQRHKVSTSQGVGGGGGGGVSPVGLDIAASDAWGRTETQGEHEPRSGGWGGVTCGARYCCVRCLGTHRDTR